jgi:hypothetical protein
VVNVHTPYKKSGCYCFRNWHEGHNVTFTWGFGGNNIKIVCVDCRVLADIQAVGGGITAASSFEKVEDQDHACSC